MRHQLGARGTVGIRLSQREAECLLAFLQKAAAGLDGPPDRGPPDRGPLDAAMDKLADAGALALWLRENVRVELSKREVQLLFHALDASPTLHGQPGRDATALGEVRYKLRASLPRGLARR